ncbi:MAG TPA: WG repeat-containing protein [Cytophagales bacterium]|nr:WG repeat-containing protein [Cytophagales bacterium]
MKKLFIITVLMALQTVVLAQPHRKHGQGCKEDLFNVQDKQSRLWGYRNFEGEWIIPAAYIEAYEFVAGKAKVKKGAKFGMIDCSGYLIINADFDDFMEFSGDRVWARKGTLWGLVSEKGQMLHAPSFDEVKKIGFENDVVWVRKVDKWGIFSEKALKFIVNPSYSDFTVASEQVSIVKLKDSLGLVDNYTGKYIIDPKITDMEKLGPRCFAYKMDGKWGAVNHLGEKVIKSDFDLLTKWQPGLVLAKKKDKYKILNEKGKSISNTYDYIGPNVNDFGVFKFGDKYGYLNKTGSIMIGPKFEEARNFSGERAIVKASGKYQIINAHGKILGSSTYDKIESDSSRRYFVGIKSNKKQLLDFNGKVMLDDLQEVRYHDIETAIRYVKYGKVGVYNLLSGQVFINPEYEDVQNFRFDQYLVKKEGLLGIVDKAGKQRIPAQYDSIDYFLVDNKVQYVVTKSGKKGLLNEQHIILYPLEYQVIALGLNKNYILKREGRYGVLNLKGEEIVPFKYDYLSNVVEEPNTPVQPLVFVKGKKVGLLNYKGEEIATFGGTFKYLGEGLYGHQEDGQTTLVNAKGEMVGKEKFQEIGTFAERMLAARKDGSWGFVSASGKFLINPVFEEVTPYVNKLAVVKKSGKYGVIDMLGREFVPFEYDSYELKEGKRLLSKGGKSYELNKTGRIKAVE